jgi:quercetin dioxygenase-like cupin family protein
MIRAGFVIENPTTRSRTTVIESDAETNGAGWLLETRCVPKSRPDIAEHFHLNWTETFEIISGTATYKLNGAIKKAQAGEKIVMPPRQPHIHPWNMGDTELVYRQHDVFETPNPQAVQDVLGVFATISGLAREGKIDRRTGLPKDPLQLAATLRTLVKHGGYDASQSISAQNFLAATLGLLAVALGYKAVYPQYVQ